MKKNSWKIIFGVYIVMVINFVVIKFNGNINNTINTIQLNAMRREQGGSNYNLVPFETVETYLSDLSFSVASVNIAGNIIPFIPRALKNTHFLSCESEEKLKMSLFVRN